MGFFLCRSLKASDVNKQIYGSTVPVLKVKKLSVRLSKNCTLCNGAMIVGDGNAIFTAECSHSFHFSCINRNQVCPTCDTKWKDMPTIGPAPAPIPPPIPPLIGFGFDPTGDSQIISAEWEDTQATLWPWNPSQTNVIDDDTIGLMEIPFCEPLDFNDDDPIDFMDFLSSESLVLNDDDPIDVIDFPFPEPLVFNDDDPLNFQPNSSSDNISADPLSGLTQATLWPCIPSPTNFNPFITSHFPSSEPLIFNDDDPLDVQSKISDCNISIGRSIDIKTHTEFPAVPRSVSQENFHILVNLKSSVTGTDQVNSDMTFRAPIDLVSVLDISGSMTGTKIQLLKRAMRFVIDNLGPSDRLSVISFSSQARRLFPLLLMTGSGLKKGTKVIADQEHKNHVCSIMLLSDGQDSNTKTINLKEISRLGIPVHTFAFGADHDPIMLHSIAEGSKGTFSFIEAEGLIQDAFAQCIGGLLSVVVQDLKVHIQSLDPYVSISHLKAGSYSTCLTGDNQTGSVAIGDLCADEERDFLVLVNIPVVADGNSNDQMKLLSVWCVYKDPFTKESVTTEAIEVKFRRPEMVNEEDMVVSIEVDRQKNRLQAAEEMSNSHAAAERGDLPAAWSVIDGCRMQLSETASAHAGDKLSVHLDFELQEESQKATARGDSTESIYQTASMSKMVQQSRAFVPNPLAHNLATVSSSSTSLLSTLPMTSNGGGGGGTADDGNKASNGI
ncbi:hypothetical protein C5167_019682 [Papaver somniferum]|uniref:RING-type domain-containing protein n=1 Tax=Papaver somniferum TaxID=3469 RepID=A0A4Y7ITZ6_PAPSO|nr:hypothetical protein C5167_019682 [Papaver somniferum]